MRMLHDRKRHWIFYILANEISFVCQVHQLDTNNLNRSEWLDTSTAVVLVTILGIADLKLAKTPNCNWGQSRPYANNEQSTVRTHTKFISSETK